MTIISKKDDNDRTILNADKKDPMNAKL